MEKEKASRSQGEELDCKIRILNSVNSEGKVTSVHYMKPCKLYTYIYIYIYIYALFLNLGTRLVEWTSRSSRLTPEKES